MDNQNQQSSSNQPIPRSPSIYDRTIGQKNDPVSNGISQLNDKMDKLILSMNESSGKSGFSSDDMVNAVNSFTQSVNKNETDIKNSQKNLEKSFKRMTDAILDLSQRIGEIGGTKESIGEEAESLNSKHPSSEKLEENSAITQLMSKVGVLIDDMKGDRDERARDKEDRQKSSRRGGSDYSSEIDHSYDIDEKEGKSAYRISRSIGGTVADREKRKKTRSSIGNSLKGRIKGISEIGLAGAALGGLEGFVGNKFGKVGSAVLGTITGGIEEKLHKDALKKKDEKHANVLMKSALGDKFKEEVIKDGKANKEKLSTAEIEKRTKDKLKTFLASNRESQKIKHEVRENQRELDEISDETGIDFELGKADRDKHARANRAIHVASGNIVEKGGPNDRLQLSKDKDTTPISQETNESSAESKQTELLKEIAKNTGVSAEEAEKVGEANKEGALDKFEKSHDGKDSSMSKDESSTDIKEEKENPNSLKDKLKNKLTDKLKKFLPKNLQKLTTVGEAVEGGTAAEGAVGIASMAGPAAALLAAGAAGAGIGTIIDHTIARDDDGTSKLAKGAEWLFGKNDAQKEFDRQTEELKARQNDPAWKAKMAARKEETEKFQKAKEEIDKAKVDTSIDKNATKATANTNTQIKTAADTKEATDIKKEVETAKAAAAETKKGDTNVSPTTVINNSTFVRPDIRNQEPSFRRTESLRYIF